MSSCHQFKLAQMIKSFLARVNRYQGELTIAKNQNTYAKRIREMEKRRKAEEKRARRKERKSAEADSLANPVVEQPPEDQEEQPPREVRQGSLHLHQLPCPVGKAPLREVHGAASRDNGGKDA